jgi:hypothetical protein
MRASILAALLLFCLSLPIEAQHLASGSLTTNGQAVSVSLGSDRLVSASVQVTGTWTGTITFQGSIDGSTFVSVLATNVATGASTATTTANGVFSFTNAGFRTVRASATAAMTGTAVVTIAQGHASGGGGGASGSVTQGTSPWVIAPETGTLATDCTHDGAACSTGPQAMAGAESTVPSAVTDGDAVRLWADLSGRLVVKSTDPCSDNSLKTAYVVDTAASGTIEFLNGAGAGNYIYICSVNLVSAGANNVVIAEDDTDNCGSITAGLNGGTTAGEGWNLAANGGAAHGGGVGWIMKSAGTNRYGCLLTSANVQLSGTIVYALAP